MNPHHTTSKTDSGDISRAEFDEPTFNRLHGEYTTADPAASDGLTAAERRLVEVLGPYASRYLSLADRQTAAELSRESPPGEIGFGEPDARA